MLSVCEMSNAEVCNLDGVVFTDAIPFPTRALTQLFRVDPRDYIAPSIHPIDRPIDSSLIVSPTELANLAATRLKTVQPDAWGYIWDRPGTVIANTGRPNKPAWINLTRHALSAANLSTRFEAIYFRPTGVSGVESKGAALQQLLGSFDTISYYDADPWVIFGLARQFKTIKFYLVQTLDAGDLMRVDEQQKFPNVVRMAQLKIAPQPPRMLPSHTRPADADLYPSYFVLHQLEMEREQREKAHAGADD